MRFAVNFMICVFLMLSVLVTYSVNAWEKDKIYDITVLHTNDHHGRFWPNDNGEYGLAAQKTLVDSIRQQVAAKGGSLLLLSGGDINTGTPESDLQNAEPDFLGMNLIGYDAMAIGNHEFDKPLTVLYQQKKWAKFPLLSANIYQKNTSHRLFQPYVLFNKQTIKIAVIGLTTDDTAKIGNPKHFIDLEFRPPASEALQLIEQLRKTEHPDIMIAVTHMGHYDNGDHGSNAPGDVSMARSLPAGYLNIIVGGHSQDPVCMNHKNRKHVDYLPGTTCVPDRQNGTWIVQAHEWGKYVGRADFQFRNGELKLVNYQLIPVNLKKHANDTSTRGYLSQQIPHDPAMIKLLAPFKAQGKEKLNTIIGRVNGRLEGARNKVRFEQTNLACLLLTVQIELTGADFAVMSGGGIRDSIGSGNITYKDLLRVQPFNNTIVYTEMKGHEVIEYLAAVANKKVDSGAYAQFANVSLMADGSGVSNVKINGQPLVMAKIYRLSTLSFNAVGGDGYPAIDKLLDYVDTGFSDVEALSQYIKKHSPLDAAQYQPKGEIVYQ